MPITIIMIDDTSTVDGNSRAVLQQYRVISYH